jgi:hypothetical protein
MVFSYLVKERAVAAPIGFYAKAANIFVSDAAQQNHWRLPSWVEGFASQEGGDILVEKFLVRWTGAGPGRMAPERRDG